jgi:hypothetical protein
MGSMNSDLLHQLGAYSPGIFFEAVGFYHSKSHQAKACISVGVSSGLQA